MKWNFRHHWFAGTAIFRGNIVCYGIDGHSDPHTYGAQAEKNFYDNEVIVINMYRIVFRPEFLWNNFFLLERGAAALELSTWTLKFELPVLGSAKLVVLDG